MRPELPIRMRNDIRKNLKLGVREVLDERGAMRWCSRGVLLLIAMSVRLRIEGRSPDSLVWQASSNRLDMLGAFPLPLAFYASWAFCAVAFRALCLRKKNSVHLGGRVMHGVCLCG